MTQEYLGLSTMSLNFDNETESLDKANLPKLVKMGL